jgi:hypothetical protein
VQCHFTDLIGMPPSTYRRHAARVTAAPPTSPATSILLGPPAADPGITDDERRTIVEMMAKAPWLDPPGDRRP